MPRNPASRIRCAICSADFPKRGGKRTCSDPCRQALADQRRPQAKPTPHRPAPPGTMQYILDRVIVDPDTGCWEWQQSLNPKTGYGQVGFAPYTAHRLAFFYTYGRYPSQVTRHTCHNRRCCNPDHLMEGTHRDNWHDSADTHRATAARSKGRPAHNRKPITVDGVTYPSRVAAMRELRVTWTTLMDLAS